MNSKETLATILIIVLIIGIAIGVFYLYKNYNQDTTINKTSVNIKVLNSNKATIEVYDSFRKFKTLETEGTWEQINLNKDYNYSLLVKADGFYNKLHQFTATGDNQEITLTKIGNLTLSQEGKITKENNNINLTFKSEGLTNRLNFCFKPELGITNVTWERPKVECQAFIPINQYYQCNETKEIFDCGEVNNQTCFLAQQKPSRINAKYCYQVGRNLIDEEITLNLKYEQYLLIENIDFITITAFDEDIVFREGIFKTYFEANEQDIGMKDITYIIK